MFLLHHSPWCFRSADFFSWKNTIRILLDKDFKNLLSCECVEFFTATCLYLDSYGFTCLYVKTAIRILRQLQKMKMYHITDYLHPASILKTSTPAPPC